MEIILSHQYPDFDALASMVAAQKIYPKAEMIIDGKANSYVQDFLALAKDQLSYQKLKDIDPHQVTKIILVDTSELARAVSSKNLLLLFEKCDLIIYDHHPYPGKRHAGLCIEPVGACTTLLVEKISKAGKRLSGFEATLLALGIYDDTGSLLFENTTSRDLTAAAYLLEQGAQLSVISEYLRRPLSPQQTKLLQVLLDNGQTETIQGMPVFISYAECREYFEGLAVLANRIGELERPDTWFLIVKMGQRVYLVGRSRGDALPVNKILSGFGGAGHDKAASAVLKDTGIEQALFSLKEQIAEFVREPHLVQDIMSFPVKTVSSDTVMEEVGKLLLRYGHTGFPVVDHGRLVGVISRRDVDKALKHGLQHAPVKGFMTKEVITVQPDLGWEEVQRIMIQHDVGRIPVVKEGFLVGIVSRSDVLRLVYGSVVPTTGRLVLERSQAMRDDVLDLIRELPPEIGLLLDKIKETADHLGIQAYLVGGFVRDLFLRKSSQDLDVVVEGDSNSFANQLIEVVEVHKVVQHHQFGTVKITFRDGTHLDIAGSRWEEYDFPGALPTIEESNLKEDLFRRDFTVNAMALCLNANRFGEVVDFYGGLRDLQQGEIRFLHNLSFIEDPTRMIRAVRFACRYHFKIAKVTREAINTALQANVLLKISKERFTEELMLILPEQAYQKMVRELAAFGLMKNWFGREFAWNLAESEEEVKDWDLEKKWLGLLISLENDEIRAVLDRLAFTKSMLKHTLDYVAVRSKLRAAGDCPQEGYAALFGVKEGIVDLLKKHEDLRPLIESYQQALQNLKMTIRGSDLLAAGIPEGPEIGRILQDIHLAWLTGKISDFEEERNYLLQILKRNSEGSTK
ncbi:CBS domain containing protein [Syntrophobotulus glycolicus DSM 8271]|uniref:CBS domain containing protein n=1 Tax=Syntrophobotulus glycolicus (strain DSM 8271 / FlGlyR) TaxID=645991 RepID=F0T066_SYNGF|nr:CBS domain-containing protein [Syntrophobotulus glycolicus]ADY56153.1 CBS domain containing protein [Syntrophobotulus glycolicus DSM 8271]